MVEIEIGDKPRLETTQSKHLTADNDGERLRAWEATQQVHVLALSLEI